MEASNVQRVAVIGGGITGLAAAHRLLELSRDSGRPVDVTLYEASEQIGGVFGTEQHGGYRFELGADMFITDKPWGVDLCRRLGLGDQLISPDPRFRKSLILHRGRPVSTPDAFNLMVPGRLWPVLTTPLLSPLGKLRLLCEPLIARRSNGEDDDETLASFVKRRLGREALERIVQPLVGGIYTGDPARLSLAATLPRFLAMEREQGSLTRGLWKSRRGEPKSTHPADVSGARYGLFVSLRSGMGSLQDALIERIRPQVKLRTGAPVTALHRAEPPANGNWSVESAAGSESFDAVILAVPAWRAAALLSHSASRLSAELAGIEYASSVIVVTGHRLENIDHPLDAYGLVVPAREKRKVLAVSFLSRKFPDCAPPGCAVLRTFVGGALQPELTELTDSDLLALVGRELSSMLGVRGDPEAARVIRYPKAMPQYNVGHLDRVRRIDDLLESMRGLQLCGSAYRGVGLPDCIHDGERAAECVSG